MPLYYDTSAPTSNNKNSITRTARDFGIRDFLLSLNIQNPIRYPQLSTSVNGSPRGGEPFLDTMVGTGAVPQQNPLEVDGVFRYDNAIIMNLYKNQDPNAPVFLDIENITTTPIFPTPSPGNNQYPVTPDNTIEQYGLLAKSEYAEYRKLATIKNLYLDATKQIDMADFISLQPIQTAQQLPSYDEAFGQIFGSSEVTQAVDIVGSILNGQGVGLSAGNGNGIGLVPNFDIRSSLAGRALGIAGVLNDTKLGIIGAEQLALALANNAAFNTQQAILGKLNVQQNINAIFGSGEFEFPRPNYKITVSDDLLGQAVGTAERILGFTIPKSRLDDSGSLFFTESGIVSNTDRANSMLTNTGKGQRKALGDQLKATLLGTSEYDNPESSPFRSGYAPFYKGGGTRDFLASGAQPKLYAFEANEPGEVYPFVQPVTEDKLIPEISYNRSKMVEDAGFISTPQSTNSAPFAKNFAWTSNEGGTTNVLGQELQQIEFLGPVPAGDTTQVVGEKKSLLNKTQKLFNSKGMMTMVSAHGSAESNNTKEQIQTAVSYNGFISKGSGVLSRFRFNPDGTLGNSSPNDSAENTFCRTWIPQNRYDTVFKLIRSRGLNQKEISGGQILTGGTKGWRLHNSERMSVLGRNGFPQIAPYKTDTLTRPINGSLPKKYMFSIENLAWVGSPAVNLLPIEQGPGDLLTGKFGRIMWFPPYDLTFSESSSVSLESNLFIGRGEPLYTYNNTERTGNLSFKIIVDHPSIVNGFKNPNGPTDEYVRSWFAGCIDDDFFAQRLTTEERTKIETRTREWVEEKTIPKALVPTDIYIYFPNDITSIDTLLSWEYENGDGKGYGKYNGEDQKKCATCDPYKSPKSDQKNNLTIPDGNIKFYIGFWPDSTDYSLNKPGTSKSLSNTKLKVPPNKEFDTWNDEAYKTALRDYLKNDCPQCVAEIEGYASKQGGGQTYANEQLSIARAQSMKKWLTSNNIIEESRIVGAEKTGVKTGTRVPYNADTPVDSEGPKLDRYGRIKFTNRAKDTVEKIPKSVTEPVPIELNQQVAKRYYSELDFFEELKREDYFIFDSFREKIRYFHPAFHSMTPEGLNARLTFLLQCTRQGPTLSNTEPENLAFGAPPVCILRIGDFYNTKIFIDNLQFDFEPLVWDLNPEGIGVQPMIANVTMSFKYIGGSSMYGPINKLQNALSFNYFANSEVYDPRADYIASVDTIKKNNLIKNFPSTITNTRKTFMSKVDAMEDRYFLIPGLDSSTQSMGAFENESPSFTPPAKDQVANNQQDNTTQATTESATTQTSVTATDPPCSSDSAIIGFGTQIGDTSNPALKILNSPDNGDYIQFFINTRSSDIGLQQTYNVTGTITNKRDGTKYEYDKGLNVSNTNIGQINYVILFNETNPQIPQQSSVSDDGYDILIKLTGQLTACTIEFNSGVITNSTVEDTNAVAKLKVDEVLLGGGTTEGGTVAFRIANNENVVIGSNFKVKSAIKSTDGQELYSILIKNDDGSDFIYNSETAFFKTFNYSFSETTPVCKGLKSEKQYFLTTTFFNDAGNEIQLNTVNLDLKATPQTGPRITKFNYVQVQQTVSGTYSFLASACQEGILKVQGTNSEQIISDADYEAFVNKGIKIRLELAASKEKIFEKTVAWRAFSGGTTDEFFNQQRLFGGGLYLGSEIKPSSDNPQIGLLGGNYNLILYYENNQIESLPVTVSDSVPFQYFGDCGTQTASAPSTSTASTTTAASNADTDVINAISIQKVYKYLPSDYELVIDFKWGRKENLKSFVLSDSKTYKGDVKVRYTENGQQTTFTFGKFTVRRNSNDSVIFGSGSDSTYDEELINTITESDGTKTWDIQKVWKGEIDLDVDEEYVNKIVAAQKDPNSILTIRWETGAESNISFYLDNSPASTSTPTLQLPITYQDEYESFNCDDAHAFGRQKGKSSGKSLTTKVVEIMEQIYNAGFNPKVTAMSVEMIKAVGNGVVYTTKYKVVVDKTDTGVAYTGFDTRGSCGTNYEQRADGQVLTGTENTNQQSPCYQKPVTQCLVDEGIAVANSFAFPLIWKSPQLEFKQFFYQFAKPSKPPK